MLSRSNRWQNRVNIALVNRHIDTFYKRDGWHLELKGERFKKQTNIVEIALAREIYWGDVFQISVVKNKNKSHV